MKNKWLKITSAVTALMMVLSMCAFAATELKFSNGDQFSLYFASNQSRIVNKGNKTTKRTYCGVNILNPLPASLYVVLRNKSGVSLSPWVSVIAQTSATPIYFDEYPGDGAKVYIRAANKNAKAETYNGTAYLN